jgi:AmmeMemoRadiSam system protein B
MYPGAPRALSKTLHQLLSEVDVPEMLSARAVIAPHAAYSCSGGVAAHSFKALAGPGLAQPVIYLLGPAHWRAIDGVGLSMASAFGTPLGSVPVDRACVQQLLAHGPPFCAADAAHAPEHCLEVELPFLHVTQPEARIVPMLFGAATDPAVAADVLAARITADPRSRVVVSSDLSHYHTYQEASRRDRSFLSALIAGDLAAVEMGEACGLLPILTLMIIARSLGWQPQVLAYRNSGDTCGSKSRVVGYAAVAYYARA